MSNAIALEGGYISREDYLRWYEAQQRGRSERVNGEIFAMASERAGHARMKAAVFLVLRRAVADTGVPCQVLPDGITVHTGESDFEPDALVNCGPPMGDDDIAAPNPIVIVEVISPNTKAVDTGLKLIGYFEVPSIQHYLIVEPVRRFMIHHQRAPEGIATRIVTAGPIALDPPGITITLEEIYEAARP